MKPINGVYTIRDVVQPHFWDIVYEWENIFSTVLNAPLFPVGEQYNRIYKPNILRKILNRFNAYQLRDKYFHNPQHQFLAFHIGPPGSYSFYSRNNVLPIIIDFWKYENLKRFESIFRLSPAIAITSKEAFDYLQRADVQLRLIHLPLSLPDKYFKATYQGTKDIDIIQIGRSNATFRDYISRFLLEFPATHYVYAQRIGTTTAMISNKFGKLGHFQNREDFIELLLRSKISLVSAPGLDADRIRTGGFSPVTPRFLESAACGCRLIGIYPQNADFDFYGIKEVCPSVNSFDHFKNLATDYLSRHDNPDFIRFLERHLTSKRATELLNKLTEINE